MDTTKKIASPFNGARRSHTQAEPSQNRAPRMRIGFSAALVALPLGFLATVLVVLQYDLALLWALPIYSLFGSAITVIMVLGSYLADQLSNKFNRNGF